MPINFITTSTRQLANDECMVKEVKFYQIAIFPDMQTKKYHIRKFVIDSNNEFIDIKNYKVTKDELNLFLSKKKICSYKKYSTPDLNNVSYPTTADISLARSPILDDVNYSGFASF